MMDGDPTVRFIVIREYIHYYSHISPDELQGAIQYNCIPYFFIPYFCILGRVGVFLVTSPGGKFRSYINFYYGT